MKQLKNLVFLLIISLIFEGCSGPKGELTGVPGRKPWFHPQPYGTVYIPSGSFHMGQTDEDIIYALTSRPRQVSVHAFFMDDTEITNNEYRQFVYWVRDSIVKKTLGDDHLIVDDDMNERINWNVRIDYSDPDTRMMLEPLYYQGNDRLEGLESPFSFDVMKLVYNHKYVDLEEAARGKYLHERAPRSDFIIENNVRVYPDTLVWIRDFTYSFNDPMTQMYFWHPAYDDYPVVGVTWEQANAFAHWRTLYLNSYYRTIGTPIVNPFRLPTEAEWEYAARGGRDFNPYPWGGPYIRNHKGCFLANFKPLRGNYIEDGGFYPVKVTSYFPNDYGLYQMAGNVAEWTATTYSEEMYMLQDDMNPHFNYRATDEEPESRKRRAIRGGSWKDVGYYLQNGTRAYEYQDTSKSYIGFRCVMSYMGRSIHDR